jgi:hypothetical protein
MKVFNRVLSLYQSHFWSIVQRTNSRRLYCMRWSMLISSSKTLNLVDTRVGMVNPSRSWCERSIQWQDSIWLFTTAFMTRFKWIASMFGDAMVNAKINHLTSGMSEEPWIGNPRRLTIGLQDTKEIVEGLFLSFYSQRKRRKVEQTAKTRRN